eukprot:7806707-Pyramimonas_sp.AAC.1
MPRVAPDGGSMVVGDVLLEVATGGGGVQRRTDAIGIAQKIARVTFASLQKGVLYPLQHYVRHQRRREDKGHQQHA